MRPRSSPNSRPNSSPRDVASASSTPILRIPRRTRSTSASATSGSATPPRSPSAELEELLELPGHVGARGIDVARDDLLERLLRGGDHDVGISPALGDRHLAVVDVDLPFARTLDVE